MPISRDFSIAVLWLTLMAPFSKIQGQNLLTDPGFDTPTPGLSSPNYPTSVVGAGAHGPASASGWRLFDYVGVTVSSQLLPTTDPQGSGYMIDVASGYNPSLYDEVYQDFGPVTSASASIDLYVVSGSATLFLDPAAGTSTVAEATDTTIGKWVTLSLPLTGGNPAEFIVSTGSGGEFYADNAYAGPLVTTSVPDKGSVTVTVVLLLPLLLSRLGLPRKRVNRAS